MEWPLATKRQQESINISRFCKCVLNRKGGSSNVLADIAALAQMFVIVVCVHNFLQAGIYSQIQ